MTLTIPRNNVFTNASLCADEKRILLDTDRFRVSSVSPADEMKAVAAVTTMISCVSEMPCTVEAEGRKAVLRKGESFVVPEGVRYTVSGMETGVLIFEIDEKNGNGPFASRTAPKNARMTRVQPPELEPFRIEELVSYENDKVVVYTLFGTEEVKLNVMCYDDGQQIGPHGRPFTGWLTVLDGHIHFEVEDDKQELFTGDSVLMPPFIPHMARAVDGNAKYLIMVIKTPERSEVQ